MQILNHLEKKFARYLPENITKILLVGQVASYVLVYTQPMYGVYFFLSGESLFAGEVWRLVTFLIGPVSDSLIFVIFAWYFFYLLGTALENKWGTFRLTFYIFISYLATIIFSLLFPTYPIHNSYLYTSLFLAFAHLYPNFQLLLFFLLPLKVRWLGYLAWFGLIVSFLSGNMELKFLILASVLNFLIFFLGDLRYSMKVILKGLQGGSVSTVNKNKPLHICAVCGKNEKDNPDMEIRYCRTCFPETCYCGEHIKDHQHKKAVN